MFRSGVDLVEIDRVEALLAKRGERFLEKVFTTAEQTACNGDSRRLAARFAAKEAVSKALGTGIGAVAWREIEVVNDGSGAPHVVLHGEAARRAQQAGLSWSISLSHSETHAIALVIGWSDQGQSGADG